MPEPSGVREQVNPASLGVPESGCSLTGQWRVMHYVETSERQRFVGLQIEFLFSLAEFGGTVVGSGKKVGVNEKDAAREDLSLLEISGEIRSSEIKLSLLERREEDLEHSLIGEIIWRRVNGNHLVGRFRVVIGDTRGRSEAFRTLQGGAG